MELPEDTSRKDSLIQAVGLVERELGLEEKYIKLITDLAETVST